MTKDEAITAVKEVTGMSLPWDDRHYEALQMAIEALSAQPDVPDTNVGDMISRQTVLRCLIDISYNQCKTQGEADVIDTAKTMVSVMPSAQPETYKEKLKEIADALSEKFAYMNTCLNERDIILGYLGVSRPSKTHCNTDCTNIKCESYRYNKRLPPAQREGSRRGEEMRSDVIYRQDTIDRQQAIDAVHKAGITEYDETLAIEEIERLPSAQPNLSEEYSKAVFTWLMDYQIKVTELKGRYTPYEVLSWVINDWRKENE